MASSTFNKDIGKLGDNIMINGANIVVRNEYKLMINDETNTRYYEIKLHNHEGSFIIDENMLERILLVAVGGKTYQCRWYYSNYTVMAYLTNDKRIFLGKYLLNNLEGEMKVFHRNLNKLDFRLQNLELKTQSEINSLGHKKRKPVAKPTKIEFFADKQKSVIKSVKRTYNSYELKKMADSNEEYYEMEVSNNITFIFDTASFDSILMFRWHIRNGYISSNMPRNVNIPMLEMFKKGGFIYLHSFLMKLNGAEIPEGSSIDHINFNKFDNRLCNLRVAIQSEQNINRPNVERNVAIPEVIKDNLTLEPAEIPLYIHLIKPKDGHSFLFEIEFSAFDILGVKHNLSAKSTSKNTLNIIEKLCHGIVIRYQLISDKNIDLTKLTIDGLKFASTAELLEYSNGLIKKFMGRIEKADVDTVAKFGEYLKRQLFAKSLNKKKQSQKPAEEKIVKRLPTIQLPVEAPADAPKYTTTLKDADMYDFEALKPSYLYYVKPSDSRSSTFDGDISICLKPRKKLAITGLSCEKLDLNERLAWSLVKRFSVLVANANLRKPSEPNNMKSLTDLIFDENPAFQRERQKYKFADFAEFRKHTETYISSILNKPTTLPDFIDYVILKVPKVKRPMIELVG